MLEQLKERVCRANLDLVAHGLVIHTWGNVSGIDRRAGMVVIKPSGVSYDHMAPADMVVVSLETGQVAEGLLHPSIDTPTHLELYRQFKSIGGIVHTHSLFATAWAQACREVPHLGTTHADYFPGPVPCTRPLSDLEIEHDYEANTGKVIAERFAALQPMHYPGVLVACHGPFSWGENPAGAVHNAVVLEHLGKLASLTLQIQPSIGPISDALLKKHFYRKHGPDSYYGQKNRLG